MAVFAIVGVKPGQTVVQCVFGQIFQLPEEAAVEVSRQQVGIGLVFAAHRERLAHKVIHLLVNGLRILVVDELVVGQILHRHKIAVPPDGHPLAIQDLMPALVVVGAFYLRPALWAGFPFFDFRGKLILCHAGGTLDDETVDLLHHAVHDKIHRCTSQSKLYVGPHWMSSIAYRMASIRWLKSSMGFPVLLPNLSLAHV